MIPKTELRCGNWVKHKICWSVRNENADDNVFFQWEDTDFYHVHESTLSYDDIYPILLTPNVLLKCGFDDDSEGGFSIQYTLPNTSTTTVSKTLSVHYLGAGESFVVYVNSEFITAVYYLHSLQNLIHSLTGTELIYTP